MKSSQLISFGSLILSLLALTAHEATAAEVRTGQRVHILADAVIEEDLYAAAREVVIDGVVHGDVVATGAKVSIHGRVDGSIMAAGGTVIVDGKIGRSVRVTGGDVQLNGTVGLDAIVACGTCVVGNAAKVGADLFAAGGDLDLSGTVAHRLRAAGGKVRLAGTTELDVQARAGTLRIETSAVTPSLVYGAREAVAIPPGVRIGHVANRPEWAPAKPNRSGGSLIAALMALLMGAVLLWLFPAPATAASRLQQQRPGAALLSGLVVAIAAPVFIVLGMITVVAIPLALLFAAVYWFAMYCGYLNSAHLLGDLILRKMHRAASSSAAFALGIGILWLISLIPVLGSIVGFLATLGGLGGLLLLLTNSLWFNSHFRRSRTGAVDERGSSALPRRDANG